MIEKSAYCKHISFDEMLYSVPYEYIKRIVDVRVTDVTVYLLQSQPHRFPKKMYGCKGQYDAIVKHVPEDHNIWIGMAITSI